MNAKAIVMLRPEDRDHKFFPELADTLLELGYECYGSSGTAGSLAEYWTKSDPRPQLLWELVKNDLPPELENDREKVALAVANKLLFGELPSVQLVIVTSSGGHDLAGFYIPAAALDSDREMVFSDPEKFSLLSSWLRLPGHSGRDCFALDMKMRARCALERYQGKKAGELAQSRDRAFARTADGRAAGFPHSC